MRTVQVVLAPVKALILSFAITAIGQGAWGVMVMANLRWGQQAPWCVPAMAGVLVLLLAYLGGAGWPRRTAAARRRLLRWNPMAPGVFLWAVFTGVLALVALGGAWIVVSDLVRMPPNVTPDVTGRPALFVVPILVMSCLAAPLSEEAAFRGYAQGMLERAWCWAPAAVVGSSLIFALAHAPQGLFLPKLGLYFLAGLIFGTIARLTNSLWASMVVHSLGDVMGFLVLWPYQSAPHRLVGEGGADQTFFGAAAVAGAFGILALIAFSRLAGMTKGPSLGRATLGPGTMSYPQTEV